MKKLFVILLLVGCNEPIRHETANYTGNSEWTKLHRLVTEIESKEVELCIKDKSTCQSASKAAQDMVRSIEK
jgi:hypothetical protein